MSARGAVTSEDRSLSDGQAATVGLMLVEHFSMIALSSAIEPLHLANRMAGQNLYRYSLWSDNGHSCVASNGTEIRVSGAYADAKHLDMLIVCGGIDIHRPDYRILNGILRRNCIHGSTIGALYTGTYVLAKAGLLDGYRATIHWEHLASLASEHDGLKIGSGLFKFDRNRFTCAGGTAVVDMMLSLIRRDHGADLAAAVAEHLIHHRIREADERQRMDLRKRFDVSHPKLLQVADLMEKTFAQPLSSQELASSVRLSKRQLERLFLKYLGCPPAKHYLRIRLEHARDLIRQTTMPLLAVAIECGFTSASHFSKVYVDHFGQPPSAERKPSMGHAVERGKARTE